MLAKVYVTLKFGVLDPQGKTIHRAVQGQGQTAVLDIRQGKYFEVKLTDGLSREDAMTVVQSLAKDVLTNTVIEDYRIELEA